ncbi:DUF2510 domain-containing protein [Auraticoccus sp. F435]|uniref:DUF2510 domain-containing protein n=1 Tax=Auraticoccus cholistanensis TaxID=2656650 RepID=A0A6A9V023_9ACTN|nr:DUF2510 domain-containing protein [Auraticoccus cholistanensis]MVA74670.1 DUF2510 domain-containing protein [Auraticoccus cholistanensis]
MSSHDTPTGSGPPPGWYPDPDGSGERWWTGSGWGEHDRHSPGPAPQGAPPPTQSRPSAPMRCHNCGGTDFTPTEYLLNTRGMSLLDLDAFNAGATCLVCRRCRYIHWFAPGV